MTRFRRIGSCLSFLLTLFVVLGTTLPSSAWVWQCRHASRLLPAPPSLTPGPMPCSMPHMSGPMPCCLPSPSVRVSPAPGRAFHFSVPACRPLLTRAASLPAAVVPLRHKPPRPAFLFCAAQPGDDFALPAAAPASAAMFHAAACLARACCFSPRPACRLIFLPCLCPQGCPRAPILGSQGKRGLALSSPSPLAFAICQCRARSGRRGFS